MDAMRQGTAKDERLIRGRVECTDKVLRCGERKMARVAAETQISAL